MKLKENRTQGDRGHEIELCQMKNIDKNVKETEWYNKSDWKSSNAEGCENEQWQKVSEGQGVGKEI